MSNASLKLLNEKLTFFLERMSVLIGKFEERTNLVYIYKKAFREQRAVRPLTWPLITCLKIYFYKFNFFLIFNTIFVDKQVKVKENFANLWT